MHLQYDSHVTPSANLLNAINVTESNLNLFHEQFSFYIGPVNQFISSSKRKVNGR